VFVAGGNGRAQPYTNTRATAPATGSGTGSTTSAPSASAWTERLDNGAAATYAYRVALFDAVLDSGSTGNILTTVGAGTKGTLIAVAIRPGEASTISIDNPAERKVYNGVSGSATIGFSGTYTGAAEDIEVQIERVVGGAVEVAWTTIAASPSGGTWSGSVSIPRGGWYVAKVRKATTTDVTAQTTSTWGVGLIVGGLGQSHMLENSTEGTGTPDSRASDVDTSVVAAMDTTGQGRIGLVNALIAACDCPVTYVEIGVSGTLVTYWYTGGSPTTTYDTWAARVTAAGDELSAWVWWQGDADAQGATSRSTYIANFEALEGQVQSDFGAPLSVIVHLGRYGAGSNTPWDTIRRAHVDLVEASTDRRGVVTIDVTQDGDNQHFPAASHEILGERIAQCIAEYVGDAAYSRGPVITSATYNGADVVVNLSHDGGADISPSSSITGIDVLDNGAPATITAAVRESASSVRLTCSATLSGPVTVRAGYGAFPTVTGWVVDDSALALPLVSTDAAVTATLVAIGSTGLAAEFEAALSLPAVQRLAIGLAAEADGAVALSPGVAASVGMAAEENTALALSPSALSSVGIATQTDTAVACAAVQLRDVGRADEIDAALTLSSGATSPVGTATEIDTAQALPAVQLQAAGLAAEVEAALALEPSTPGAVGVAAEADTALPLAAVQIAAIGLAIEPNQALALAAVTAITAGLALEIEVAFALGAKQSKAVGLAFEVDLAMRLAGGEEVAVLVPFPRTPKGVTYQPMHLGVDCFPI
jgi:hypothetical protein